MRTYGRRFMRNTRQREIQMRKETENAVVWSIDEDNKKANVRIQGSNTTISAYFPVSYYSMPSWVKLGAPVRILYSGGFRGRVELLGPGLFIPYPQTGAVWPTPPARANRITSGLKVMPIPNTKRLAVMITPGTCVITDTDITVDEIAMDPNSEFVMGDGGYMGNVAGVFNVTIPTGLTYPLHGFQIHNFFVDGSGDLSMSSGRLFEVWMYDINDNILRTIDIPAEVLDFEDSETPTFPEEVDPPTEAAHLKLGSCVTWEDCEKVEVTNLNWLWKDVPYDIYSRFPTYIMDITDAEDHYIDWGDQYVSFHVKATENTGNDWIVNQIYYLKAEITSGTGQVTDGFYGGEWGTECTCINLYDQWTDIYYPEWVVKVKRDNLVTDRSPMIKCTLMINTEIICYSLIVYLDAGGAPM